MSGWNWFRHVVMAGKTHPLAGQTAVAPGDLVGYPWTFLAHDIVGRRQLSAFFGAAGVDPPSITLETPSVACAAAALAHGKFLACLAEPLLKSQVGRDLVPLPVEGPTWHYRAGIARRTPVRSALVIDRFVAQLQGMFQK